MFWRQLVFRTLGVLCIGGGVFALYDYGKEIPILFKLFVAGSVDSFTVFIVGTSFFFGAFAMIWVGIMMSILRSFSIGWLYFVILPIAGWLMELYDIGLIFKMDKILSQSVVFLCIYMVILILVRLVQRIWYTPVSHESMRHVGIEHQGKATPPYFKWMCILLGIVGLLVLHPGDLSTTLRMLFSPIMYVVELL